MPYFMIAHTHAIWHWKSILVLIEMKILGYHMLNFLQKPGRWKTNKFVFYKTPLESIRNGILNNCGPKWKVQKNNSLCNRVTHSTQDKNIFMWNYYTLHINLRSTSSKTSFYWQRYDNIMHNNVLRPQ